MAPIGHSAPDVDGAVEARAAYQKAGATYLIRATALATTGFGGFYLIDVASGIRPALGGTQTLRLIVSLAFALVTLYLHLKPAVGRDHYRLVMNLFAIVGIQLTCLISFTGHRSEELVSRLFSMDMSLVIAIVIVYGFSRLSALNTTAIALSGFLTAFAYLGLPALADQPQLMRVFIHLSITTTCLFSLRLAVERREIQLYLLAKENLRRNIYAKQLQAAKDAADLANESKSRFLANMSHEIRTPMNGVLQTLETLGSSVPDAQRPLLEVARSSGRALLRILNGILDYTKLNAGKGRVISSAVDVRGTVQTVAALYSAAASRKGLDLRTEFRLRDDVAAVETDEVKIFEVLSNVVSNAVKFTDRGFIAVAAECDLADNDKARVRLCVTDSGIGMSESEATGLFTPFFQANNATTRTHDGTGLGLAISKEIMTLLGGDICVSSQPGAGTKVTITFEGRVMAAPQGSDLASVAAAAYASPEPIRPAPAAAFQSLESCRGSVLLVEDNPINAALTHDLLTKLGYEVVLAENGGSAVSACEVRRFDLVLMDCQMPIMDGFETTSRLRMQEARRADLAPMPIVAVTANTLAGDRERCLACGMNDYLAKPYTVRQLRSILEKWQPAQGDNGRPPSGNVVEIRRGER